MTEWQFVLYFMAVLHSVGAEDWDGVGTACNDDKIRALVTDRLEKRGIDSHSIKAFLEEMQLQYRANVSNSIMSASYDAMYLQFVSLMIEPPPSIADM